jgi:hypothetical protein
MHLHSAVLRSSGLVQNAFIYYQGKERVELHTYPHVPSRPSQGKCYLVL